MPPELRGQRAGADGLARARRIVARQPELTEVNKERGSLAPSSRNSKGRHRSVTKRSPPRSDWFAAWVIVAVPVSFTETTSRSESVPFSRAGVVTRPCDEFRDFRR